MLTTADKIRALPWFYAFQACTVVFILLTLFGPVFPMFMHTMGLNKSQIGMLLAIPHLFTPLALLATGFVLRHGPKRIFLAMTAARSLVIAGLLALPLLHVWLGTQGVLALAAVIISGFALCRAVAETGYLPWEKDIIPDRIRGKASAINGIVCGLTAILTSLCAALILRRLPGVHGFQALIMIGIVFSAISMWCLRSIPGGAPVPASRRTMPLFSEFAAPLRDRNFQRFLVGNGLFMLGCGVFPFLPLFLQEQLGLPADKIMFMDMAGRAGVMVSSFFWGWNADRFGARPVIISGIILMLVFALALPLLPQGIQPLALALGLLYLVSGMAMQGYLVGLFRYLYVNAIPPKSGNASYYSLHYAITGLCTAIGPLLAGRLIDVCAPLHAQWHTFTITPFTLPLLIAGALFGIAAYIMHRLAAAGAIPTGKFLSMLLQGNPLLAFGSILRYQFAWTETERVANTERMGQARSALSEDELLEALQDPGFNVRYEAILAIARMPPAARLTDALINLLRGQEPDLSVAAGWALGRLCDPRAIPALRETLHSEYALLRSRAARSLAAMHDHASADAMLVAMRQEPHDAIRVAYATALGSLRASKALPDILELFQRLTFAPLRNETAMAIARMLNCERRYLRLWRGERNDPGDACAEALRDKQRDWAAHPQANQPELTALLEACQTALRSASMDEAARAMARLLEQLPAAGFVEQAGAAPHICREILAATGAGRPPRIECLILAICLLAP